MKKLLLVGLGAGAGYVLGARAGRPAYDRLERQWHQLSQRLGIPQMRDDIAAAGVDLTDAARQQAVRSMDEATTRATDVMHRTAADMRGSTSSMPEDAPSARSGAVSNA